MGHLNTCTFLFGVRVIQAVVFIRVAVLATYLAHQRPDVI